MNKIKKVICKNWIEKKCKFMDNSKLCSFAHGEDDIIKNECFNGIYCWNEKCIYQHSKNWNPYNNKKECLICLEGYCNKINNKYNHIKDTNINDIKVDNSNTISYIPKNDDFPEIIKNNNNNKIIHKHKYSDVLKSKLKNEDIIDNTENYKNVQKTKITIENEDELITIKKELYNEYKYLSKLDQTEWANYDEIHDIKDRIQNLEYKYKEIKNKYKKEDIFNDKINMDIIFNEDSEKEEKNSTPIINLIINDNSIDNSILNNINKEINNNINNLIEEIEKDLKTFSKEIKNNINKTIKNNHFKYILINNLNEISSIINLFKNNYNDVMCLSTK